MVAVDDLAQSDLSDGEGAESDGAYGEGVESDGVYMGRGECSVVAVQ